MSGLEWGAAGEQGVAGHDASAGVWNVEATCALAHSLNSGQQVSAADFRGHLERTCRGLARATQASARISPPFTVAGQHGTCHVLSVAWGGDEAACVLVRWPRP